MAGILFHKYGGEDLDSYYPIRPECQADVPKVRFKARVGILYRCLHPMYLFLDFVEGLYFIGCAGVILVMHFYCGLCIDWCVDGCVIVKLCCLWQAGKTLSARRWHAAFSEDGHLDIAKVLRRIQRGVRFFYL